uniref:Uncharacterized protein n=1 Tax=Avena sativa TaxID=4498 RepID=A0ACD5XPL5_AVESA
MSLQRLLGLSAAAVSVHLRRSLSTDSVPTNLRRSLSAAASSHPPWAMIDYNTLVDESSSTWASGACFSPLEPPGVSRIYAPAHLLSPRERPAADSNVVQVLTGHVIAASGDGHLLLTYYDILAEGPRASWNQTADMEAERFICNPISGQLLRLPYIDGSRKRISYCRMGLLTQPGDAHGPRFAVADIVSQRGGVIDRFLPELGRWDMVVGLPCQPTLEWEMDMNQETVAFGGRLWWVDLTCGAISMDPFSHRPELRFVELPSGCALTDILTKCKDASAEDRNEFMREVAKYRRIGVSEGRLRYVETSLHEPFLLSSYVLDEEGSSWTLEQQVELKQVLADGGHEWKEKTRPPQIAVIDPMNSNVVYITVGEQEHVVAVDIYQEKVIGSSPLQNRYHSLVPCVLPPLLGSSQIPTAGNKGDMEAIDVLVSCGRHYKR